MSKPQSSAGAEGDLYAASGAVRIPLEEVTPEIARFYGDDECLIWSSEWKLWWRANGNGYTNMRDKAGRYAILDAYARTRHCDSAKGIMFEQVLS